MDIFWDILLKPPQPFIGLFLTLHYYGKIEGNKYLHFAMFWIYRHFENCTPPTKPSSKERIMKISKHFQPQNEECINQ